MRKFFTLLFFLMPYVLSAQTWPSSLKGRWTFDNPANLLKATVGNDLVLDSTGTGAGVHTAITGPTTTDGAVNIKLGSYYHCYHDIPANGGGTKVNKYSILIDFRVPSLTPWYSFFQTDLANSLDGTFWVDGAGKIGKDGVSPGYSTFEISAGKWYRLLLTVDMGNTIKYYVDGQLIHTGNMSNADLTGIDGLLALSAGAGVANDVLLFADNNGEDTDIDIAQVAIFDAPLSASEVTGLGAVVNLKGQWTFDDPANLLKATVGNDLVLGGQNQHEAIAGPTLIDGAVSIKKGSFYHCYHDIPANGGGAYVNQYSLLVDFRLPESNKWYSFFQTAVSNGNDGELFVNANGTIGDGKLGYSTSTVDPNKWYRLVVTLDLGNAINYYIDGQLIHTGDMSDASTHVDDRWSLYSINDLNDVLLFADDNGEDADIDVAQVAIYDGALSAEAVAQLGKITLPPAPKGQWTFDDPANLLKATVGKDLVLDSIGTGAGVHAAIAGPIASDRAVSIKQGSYYHCYHDIPANGGGTKVNKYSLLMDFRVSELGRYYAFYQTNVNNNDDAELFMNTDGSIGISALGYSPLFFASPGQWYRLVITVDMGNAIKIYVNGELVRDGNMPADAQLDGRWALNPGGGLNDLLLFADNDAEDNDIDIAQVTIYDNALSAAEVAALGSITTTPVKVKFYPYLENPTPTSMYISWQNTKTTVTKVIYNTDALSFPLSQTGTYDDISGKKWNTVKLTGLTPNTTYYYRCISGTDTSEIFPFHTPALAGATGSHIRFAIIGDSQENLNQSTNKVANAMKAKFEELYGTDWYNKVNLVMHTGDIIQNGNINEFESEYFMPFAEISRSVPFMISPGNHEQNNAPGPFYQYVHYDDFSDVQYPDVLCERYYSFILGNVQFIVTNSGGTQYCNSTQKNWVQQKLNASKDNATVDFVFTFGHQAKSEIWPDGNNTIIYDFFFPLFAQYPKVAMYSYGHTHAFERGTFITNNSEQRDFRTVIFGGGGGSQDRWGGAGLKHVDLPNVNKSFDYYGYVIVDVDMDNKSYTATAYGLGNPDHVMDNVAFDSWHGVIGRAAPAKPVATLPESNSITATPTLVASAFSGVENDSIMSSQFQLTATQGNFTIPLIDTVRNWVDIYGVDASFIPVDKNTGIDLTSLQVKTGILSYGNTYYWRVRYRDHNCRWSEWSDAKALTIGVTSIDPVTDNEQILMFPNPASTDITVNGNGILRIDILTVQGVCLKRFDIIGDGDSKLSLSGVSSGIYIVKIYTQEGEVTKNLIVR